MGYLHILRNQKHPARFLFSRALMNSGFSKYIARSLITAPGCGVRIPVQAFFSACLKSSMRSFTPSTPTEILIIPGVTPWLASSSADMLTCDE